MYVLVSLDTAKVLASVDRKIDGLSQWARNGKVLQIVEVKGLIQKRKMKVKKKRPVIKGIKNKEAPTAPRPQRAAHGATPSSTSSRCGGGPRQ